MKIFIIGPAHPLRGGIAALNERLARQLMEEGHTVRIISFKLQYPGFLFPGKSQFTDSPAPGDIAISRQIHSLNPINWIRTGLGLKKERPDLIIVRYWLPFMAPSTGTVCKLIRSNRKTKIIALVDNILPHEARPGDRLLTRYFVRYVDGFLAMSKNVYEDLRLFISKKQRRSLTPHPIYDHYGDLLSKEKARELLHLNPDKKYLLFFGFIRDYKGLDLLLAALPEIVHTLPDVRLLVAGEFYGNEKKYHQLMDKLNVKEFIDLHTEYIPEHEVNRYFCAADLVTQPYKSATQSGVTQIGFHFHKPMLVTRVGGLAEIIHDGQTGYVVPPDPGSIARAVIDFYTHKREEPMRHEVAREKERFGWDKLTGAIMEMYEQCTSNK
ncbi:MAG TPA: glycosyltransferase [Prolixibacteraceae bacterium]|nr:glycosyltransferase [Prolixibacteraceae bacterium]